MIKRLLFFSSICSPVAISALQVQPTPPQPRPMQSAETHSLYAALRRAQPNFKETPRFKQQFNSDWALINVKLRYGYDHVVAAAKQALKDQGLVVSQQHVAEPRPMILTFVAHPESKQFVGSAKIVPQHPHHSTPTQTQYNQTAVSAYVEAVGLEVPLDQLIEDAPASEEPSDTQN